MEHRKFPGESAKKQRVQIKPCCKDNLKEWDCGCSWGCEVCWIAYACTKCSASYDSLIAREVRMGWDKNGPKKREHMDEYCAGEGK